MPLSPALEGRDLQWPPPGLERIEGDIWKVVRTATLAALILVFPLLLSISLEQDFWSLGPLGSAWWVILITTGLGAGLILEAVVGLVRLLRRGSRAIERGYDWRTVAQVACDAYRDTGFLLQGARWYGELDSRERDRIGRLRLIGATLRLASAMWLAGGFSFAVLGAARGVFSADTVTWITLGPAAVCLLFAVLARRSERGLVRKARRRWFEQPWAQQLERSEVEAWRNRLRGDGQAEEPSPKAKSHARILRLAAIGVGALGMFAVLPPVTLVPTSAVGPIMASVVIPRLAQTQARAARAEAFRPYRIATATVTDPVEAGRLLQTLIYVGRTDGPARGEVAPRRRYVEPWLPPPDSLGGGQTGVDPRLWGVDLLPNARDLETDVESYLAIVASHEAHEAFSRLAASARLNVLEARWVLPFADVGIATLPVPRFGHLRQAAQAHVGKAIHELTEGREAAAELLLREIVSVGFLLADDAPTVIDNLVGFGLVGLGAEALESFYAATGRTAEAVALRQARDAAARAADVLTRGGTETLESSLAALPVIAANPGALRGLRWQLFTLTNTLVPCINLNRIVFGPDEAYEVWVEQVRATLVRWPSEQALFDLALDGYVGSSPVASGTTLLGSLIAITMGGSNSPGSCATVFRRFDTGP